MHGLKKTIFLAPILIAAGCLPRTTPPEPVAAPAPSVPAAPAPAPIPSAAPAPETPPTVEASYAPFTRAAYDGSIARGEPVLLFFYANWCPFCKAQDPVVVSLFKDATLGVKAYRVNYNDSETDEEEKRLANAFGVTYQHTFILLNTDGKEVARRVGTMSAEELKTFLEKAR